MEKQNHSFEAMPDAVPEDKRQGAEAALREAERHIRTIMATVPDFVTMWDRDGKLQFINRLAPGFTLQQAIGRSAFEFIPAAYRETMRQALHSVFDTGESVTVENEGFGAHGELRWYLTRIAPILKEQQVANALVVATDITERKQALMALQESQAHLVASQRVARVGSWELLLQSPEIDANPLRWTDECYRIFGYEPGKIEASNAAFWARVHPDDQQKVRAAIRRAFDTRSVYETEHRAVMPDGSQCMIAERGEFIIDAQTGKPIKLIGTCQDITERIKLEEQLRQSQKIQALGQLAGGVAHDFNNLLTVINGYCSLLFDKAAPADPQREPLAAIRDAADRAALLTRQLLLFSRKAVHEASVLDLNDAVQQTGKMLRRLIGEDITLTTVLAPALHRIKADPGQVEQVIMNLALNARDAMPRGGRLTVETRNSSFTSAESHGSDGKPGRYVELIVNDTGCGMTPEIKAHLFEPFFTTKGPGKGTGLGLATVYGIVRGSGGFVRVASEVGAGATFNICFPALDAEAPVPQPNRTDVVALRGSEAVLLVEDEESVRRVARIALELHGYQVLEAACGTEAIALVDNSGVIDLLLTDVVMPEVSGRQLAEILRAGRPQLKVLFMSGHNDEAVIRHGLLEASSAFLQKPFTPLALARKVREILDQGAPNSAP
jgi:two-component system, cell cycle sensor histidine kinase and response regulator CckA